MNLFNRLFKKSPKRLTEIESFQATIPELRYKYGKILVDKLGDGRPYLCHEHIWALLLERIEALEKEIVGIKAQNKPN